MNIWRNERGNWCRTCPSCKNSIEHRHDKNAKYYASHCSKQCKLCASKGKNNPFYGKKHKDESKRKMSVSAEKERKLRYSYPEARERLSISVKKSMNKPEVRKKHINALHHSQWIKVKTDNGQLEMIEKWNKLGFNFKPNYQIKTDSDLFYIDGYDEEKNVVLEYDSKYHDKSYQQKKDLVRQSRIIHILSPKKFWRYNKNQKSFRQIIGDTHYE